MRREPQQDLHQGGAQQPESGDHDCEQRREHPTDDPYFPGEFAHVAGRGLGRFFARAGLEQRGAHFAEMIFIVSL